MLHWALAAHPNLWGGEESDFLYPLVPALVDAWEQGSDRGERHWLNRCEVSRTEFLEHFAGSIDDLFRAQSGGRRWIDQTPRYALIASELLELFPGAVVVHIVRDARQVICSMQEFFGWTFRRSMRAWRSHVHGALDAERTHPGRCYRIRYEDIVRQPEAQVESLLDVLGESFSPAVVRQLESPLNSNPIEGRENPLDHLAPRWTDLPRWKTLFCRAALGGTMRRLGYST